MKNNLSCNTVQDLLPIYLDEIASEETNQFVKKHLGECPLCLNEYKKLCEMTESNGKAVKKESASIMKLKKKLMISFITVIIFGVFFIAVDMFCFYVTSMYNGNTIFELLSILELYIAKYLLPLFGIFISMIWKKTITKKEKVFWPNVTISFWVIFVLIQIIFLVLKFFSVIMDH